MTLATTNTQLHELETALDGTRAGSTTVRVDKEALRALIADHYALNLAVARKCGELPKTKE